MKVLLAASEAAPIVKLGGLGDVIGSLPKALQRQGVNIDVIIPFYPLAKIQDLKIYKALELNVPFDGENHLVEVHKTQLPNSDVDTFLLRNSDFFTLGGKSAFLNTKTETEMFAFFNRAVVEFIKSQFNTYDLVHCNDWHTGLITHMLKDEIPTNRPATLLTIHNILYQGVGDRHLVEAAGFVPGQHPLIDWDLEDGDINMMLQGITSADYINTVSPTYAQEIVSKEFGGGFADILRNRSGRLSGILNGLDLSMFPRNYDVHDVTEGKLVAKKKLAKKLGFNVADSAENPQVLANSGNLKEASKESKSSALSETPVFGYIGRLDPGQKGLDILHKFLDDYLSGAVVSTIASDAGAGANTETTKKTNSSKMAHSMPHFVILGKGDPIWEGKFRALGEEYENLHVVTAFDEELAKEIYAGSDFLLVPSRYEPCGLIQMIAMWYGSLPIVRATGGLKDTVENGVTGFVFRDYSAEALARAVESALRVFWRTDDVSGSRLETMRQNAMRKDFSWDKSAQAYKDLYSRAVKLRQMMN
ncbi:glycosyltransferase [candidate division WWE3 bacterium]|nr:glycosyltransferase [candidate division WWE3 bacterium]